MYKYKVGGYLKGLPEPVQEGCTMLYDESGPVLLISLSGLTGQEAKKLKKGKVEFAIFKKDTILFLLVKVPGVMDWSDAPFHIGLYADDKQVPDIPEGRGLGLTMIGLDANDGQIMALRLVGLGTAISQEMVSVMREQKTDPTDQFTHGIRVDRIYHQYSCVRMAAESVVRYTAEGRL